VASWGQTPLEWSANMNARAVADLLLASGGGSLGLWTASALGRTDVVEGLLTASRSSEVAGRPLRKGADLSGWPPDSPFRTGDAVSDAFYIACRNGHTAAMRLLLARGAKVDATGYFGASALHWGAAGGHTEVVEALLDAGADPRLRDPKFDATPAAWAREHGHVGLAEVLDRAASS